MQLCSFIKCLHLLVLVRVLCEPNWAFLGFIQQAAPPLDFANKAFCTITTVQWLLEIITMNSFSDSQLKVF